MKLAIFITIITTFITLFTQLPILFQTTPTPDITATPAPTKTAPANSNSTVITTPSTETIEQTTQTTRTLTQEDLSVITGNVQRPNGIVWHNGLLYVACTGDWTLYEINDTTGETRTYIYGVRNSHSMYVDPGDSEGNQLTLWVPDFDTNTLFQINPSRSPQPVARNLGNPWGIAYLDENHFLVTSLRENSLSIISREGAVQTILDELRSPTGIATHGNYAYVANSGSARRAIEWIDLTPITNTELVSAEGSEIEVTTQPLVSGLQSTTNIVMGSDDKLYFAYSLGTRGVVGRIDPDSCREKGGCSNDEVEIVLYTDLTAPLAGLAITPDMRLFVHTMFRPEIYWTQIPQGLIN